MQMASSACLACSDALSASEWIATVGMPRALADRNTRHAISPRFATRIFLNMTNQLTYGA